MQEVGGWKWELGEEKVEERKVKDEGGKKKSER